MEDEWISAIDESAEPRDIWVNPEQDKSYSIPPLIMLNPIFFANALLFTTCMWWIIKCGILVEQLLFAALSTLIIDHPIVDRPRMGCGAIQA
jgi:hypothetical protein